MRNFGSSPRRFLLEGEVDALADSRALTSRTNKERNQPELGRDDRAHGRVAFFLRLSGPQPPKAEAAFVEQEVADEEGTPALATAGCDRH